jgi:acetyl-CoA carboxylase carboxyltransferase component
VGFSWPEGSNLWSERHRRSRSSGRVGLIGLIGNPTDAARVQGVVPSALVLRAGVGGSVSAAVAPMGHNGRLVVVARTDISHRRGALGEADSATLAAAAAMALRLRLPLVCVLASSGADVNDGVAGLQGWGMAARALAACSGLVPVLLAVVGPAMSGPALLLGMADAVVMTADSVAYLSGPGAVAEMTGLRLGPEQLGGASVHARATGVAALIASDADDAEELLGLLLGYLPDHTDAEPPSAAGSGSVSGTGSADPPGRLTPELRDILPASPTGSYDVRGVAMALADHGELLELRAGWAPQLVTALARVDGRPIGILANQPQTMAGTLDIAASQKAARFVAFCDAFNLPIVTLVDTPGFMPGKDLEWRGMIRLGAQLVFTYAEATVPRVCLILRKAYGGAYIVMDSKAMGNDVCLAWPSAEVAVMGAQGAVQILHRQADGPTQGRLADEYQVSYLNPYTAAERGYIDAVIDPAETRVAIARSLAVLRSKREQLPGRKHGNGPL